MKSILLIIPYFGSFPKQFKFWLQSVFNNPSIDFLLITDNFLESKSNLRVINQNFSEFKDFIQSKFDFKIALPSPYKICDFRGAYGHIFEDYTKHYDFWGFSDIDLVYGDIRYFLHDEILEKYKVLMGYGHFTLYKNNDECNRFYMSKIEGFQHYKITFTHPRSCLFDEFHHGGLSDMWKYADPDHFWSEQPFDDIEIPLKYLNFRSISSPEATNNLIFEYYGKQLFRTYINQNNQIEKEPTLYAHFQMRKFMRVKTNDTEKYLIVPNSFIKHTTITIVNFKKWTRPFELRGWLWTLKYRIYKRIFFKEYALRQNAFSKLAQPVYPLTVIKNKY